VQVISKDDKKKKKIIKRSQSVNSRFQFSPPIRPTYNSLSITILRPSVTVCYIDPTTIKVAKVSREQFPNMIRLDRLS
jgi:hypothetical protein